MDLKKKTEAFRKLGKFLLRAGTSDYENLQYQNIKTHHYIFDQLVRTVHQKNPWFHETYVRYALTALGKMLCKEDLLKWISMYTRQLEINREPMTIGVIMAGNIPLVGFHDFLCILMAGHHFKGKMSSSDKDLLPAIVEVLLTIEPAFANLISFTEDILGKFDAVIATGSDNSMHYFETYFNKYPHILRKNRNGVAILTGNETGDDLEALANDIFLYFGLGCRNVSKLYVPVNYDFSLLLEKTLKFRWVMDHYKYRNNYDYNRSIYTINNVDHLDNGIILLTKNSDFSSPVAVLYYETYDDTEVVGQQIKEYADKIQCLLGDSSVFKNALRFGSSQSPSLWDYADGIDTMQFLCSL